MNLITDIMIFILGVFVGFVLGMIINNLTYKKEQRIGKDTEPSPLKPNRVPIITPPKQK